MRIFSYGGGVQSTAVLVLAARGDLNYDHYLFCNVGQDSEHPATLKYFQDIAMPYAAKHKIDLIMLQKQTSSANDTIRKLIFSNVRTIPIPERLMTGAPGNRKCTYRFKIRVVDKWAREHINGTGNFVVGLGISLDEYQRAKARPPQEVYKGLYKTIEYPLLDMRLTRAECRQIVNDAGLPAPPKSACYFCPFHTDIEWHELRQKYPDLFADAVAIEKRLQQKRKEYWNKDKVWLHRKLIPLDQAVPNQPFLFNISHEENCESGYCFT